MWGLRELTARLTQYLGIIGVVFLASAFVALILSSKLQRVISTPILDLVRASNRVSENQDYNVRVEGKNRDEIGQLISAFNEMISQIQERDVALIDAFNDQMARGR